MIDEQPLPRSGDRLARDVVHHAAPACTDGVRVTGVTGALGTVALPPPTGNEKDRNGVEDE